MAGYISDEIINKISEQTDIVEVISEYLPLKKAGKNYKALCPFHEERTPSFIVSPEKQLFHCFGCGVGGNVFTFLMKWEKISFPEAVRMLGEKLGIPISVEEEKGEVPKKEFYQINESVANFFQGELRKNKVAQDYLKRRGFSEKTLDTWKVGYAPASRVFLSFCKKKGISLERLRDLGLLSLGKEDWYAYFRERIIFPIFTPQGRICGFGGRVLDSSSPKYLNSPQSPVFDKGRVLYGLNFSKEAIGKEKAVVLVEGYTDAITLYQGGIRNVVASLGTSLTVSQARLIKRYADEVFIAYDQDKAGIAATLRGIDLLLEADLKVRIISLPRGMDPAEFLDKKGAKLFVKEKDKAISYFDYRVNLEIGQSSFLEPEDKLRVVNALFPTLSRVKNLIKLQELIKKLAHRLNIDESLLGMEFEKFKRRQRPPFSPEIFKVQNDQEKTEKILLQLMLNSTEVVRVVEEKWDVDYFVDPFYKKIAQRIISLTKNGELSPSILINRLREEDASSFISSFSLSDDPFRGIDKKKTALDIIKTLQRNRKQKKIDELRKRIEEGERKGEEEKIKEWLEELTELKKQILLR